MSLVKIIFKQIKVNTSSCFLLLPAFFMALMPWSLEESFNLNFLGYDMPLFLMIGYIILLLRKNKQREKFVLFTLIFAFIAAVLCLNGDIVGRYFIGIEFIVGYLFAKEIRYNDDIIKIINLASVLLLIAILFQQISLTFGLGFIESGQEQVFLSDGMLRVGTSVGSSTLTGILVVLILAIILHTSKNILFDYVSFALGTASVLLSGTRSAMLILLLIGGMMLFGEKYKIPKFFKILFIAVCIIYVMPFVTAIFEARNEVAGDSSDITSGRVERWLQAFSVLNESPLNYLFGVGPASVPISMFNEHINPVASPHNVYIGTILEFGIFYTIAFIVFVYRKILRGFNFRNIPSLVLLGSMLVSWNTEVVPLSFLYSFFFWLLFFLNVNTKTEYENSIY